MNTPGLSQIPVISAFHRKDTDFFITTGIPMVTGVILAVVIPGVYQLTTHHKHIT